MCVDMFTKVFIDQVKWREVIANINVVASGDVLRHIMHPDSSATRMVALPNPRNSAPKPGDSELRHRF